MSDARASANTDDGEANLRYRLAHIRKLELRHDILRGEHIRRVDSDTVYHRMLGLIVAYPAIMVVALLERNWPRALYFVGAILISVAVLWMTEDR